MSASLQEKWHETPAGDRSDQPDLSAVVRPIRQTEAALHHDLAPSEFRFGRWCLVPGARLLLHDGLAVELGSRTFDLLHLLLSRRGFVVEKNAILGFVWPNVIVDECNLRSQVAILRRILGEERHLIKTIGGRGYIFAAEYHVAG